jgi:hypothetical protein
MTLYVVANASFDYNSQSEEISLRFTSEKPSKYELFLDVSFLCNDTSPPEEYDGVVLRRNRTCFEFVSEENVDFTSHWPGEDDAYWEWDDLEEEYKNM